MPVPTNPTLSAVAKVTVHSAFRDLVDAGSGPGSVRVKDSADVLLAQIPLNDPCGSVNNTTGLLSFSIGGADTSADATGVVAYVEICDSTGAAHLAVPAQLGSAVVSGKAVFHRLNVTAGETVEILSIDVG